MARSRVKEVELSDALVGALRELGWDVDRDVQVGPYRPDFVLRSTSGKVYLVEVKADTGVLHFAALSQAAAYRDAFASSRVGHQPTAVVLSAGTAPPGIRELADELQVEIVTADDAGDVAAASKILTARLAVLDSPNRAVSRDDVEPASAASLDPAADGLRRRFDVFMSYSHLDKELVGPLVDELKARGVSVWYDETELAVGDDVVDRISTGLATSRFAVVVLSPHTVNARWQARELATIAGEAHREGGRVLPIWHGVSRDTVSEYAPALADTLALQTDTTTINDMADKIALVVARSGGRGFYER